LGYWVSKHWECIPGMQGVWLFRDSFYRFKELYETGGELAFRNHRKKPAEESCILEVEKRMRWHGSSCLWTAPRFQRVEKAGCCVSAGVRSIWLRHDLETFKKRLKALEQGGPGGFDFDREQCRLWRKPRRRKAFGRSRLSIRISWGQDTFTWAPEGWADLPADVH